MTPSITDERIVPLWKCLIERIPGEGYVVTEWARGDAKFTGTHADAESKRTVANLPRPDGLPFSDEEPLNILGSIEKTFPDVNTTLTRITSEDKKYLVAGTVWTPPESNDCFLLKWYEDSPKKSWTSLVLSILLVLLLIPLVAVVVGLVNGEVKIACLEKEDVPSATLRNHVTMQNVDDKYKDFFENEVSDLMDSFEEYFRIDPPKDVRISKPDASGVPHYVSIQEYIDSNDSILKNLFDRLRKASNKFKDIQKDKHQQTSDQPGE